MPRLTRSGAASPRAGAAAEPVMLKPAGGPGPHQHRPARFTALLRGGNNSSPPPQPGAAAAGLEALIHLGRGHPPPIRPGRARAAGARQAATNINPATAHAALLCGGDNAGAGRLCSISSRLTPSRPAQILPAQDRSLRLAGRRRSGLPARSVRPGALHSAPAFATRPAGPHLSRHIWPGGPGQHRTAYYPICPGPARPDPPGAALRWRQR